MPNQNIDWYADIMEVTAQDIIEKFGKPDVIWASPPCTSYSIAAISHHREKNPITGNLDPVSDFAKLSDNLVQHANVLTKLFYGENGLCNIDHDNPHHTLSIGNHCIACYLNTLDYGNKADMNLHIAALLHDIGKPFTKDYKDSKGNPCEIAHYYQHHLVSAYNAVPYLQNYSFEDMMEILALIQWHMFPYFWEKDNNEKMKKKYKKLWGDNLFDKIMLLHTADRNAH